MRAGDRGRQSRAPSRVHVRTYIRLFPTQAIYSAVSLTLYMYPVPRTMAHGTRSRSFLGKRRGLIIHHASYRVFFWVIIILLLYIRGRSALDAREPVRRWRLFQGFC